MDFYLSAIISGLCLSAMGLGIFISMKIFNIPDITTDGSFTLGAMLTAILLNQGQPIFYIVILVLLSGAIAGCLTALLHTFLKVNALLAGILVMTSLYSINILIAGMSNVPLNNTANIFETFIITNNEVIDKLIIALSIISFMALLLWLLLQTDLGIAMRATGNNSQMVRALGVSDNLMKIFGLAIANALTAFSGFLLAQKFHFADRDMGIGIVITGLGSVLIADALRNIFKLNKMIGQIVFVVLGCIIFQVVQAITLQIVGVVQMKQLVIAVFVLVIVVVSKFFNKA